eukprot:867890-Prorocentrum_minimum.AAC.2
MNSSSPPTRVPQMASLPPAEALPGALSGGLLAPGSRDERLSVGSQHVIAKAAPTMARVETRWLSRSVQLPKIESSVVREDLAMPAEATRVLDMATPQQMSSSVSSSYLKHRRRR